MQHDGNMQPASSKFFLDLELNQQKTHYSVTADLTGLMIISNTSDTPIQQELTHNRRMAEILSFRKIP